MQLLLKSVRHNVSFPCVCFSPLLHYTILISVLIYLSSTGDDARLLAESG